MTIAQIVHDNEVWPFNLLQGFLWLDFSIRNPSDTLTKTFITK